MDGVEDSSSAPPARDEDVDIFDDEENIR